MSPTLFDALSKEATLKDKPGAQLFLVLTAYTDEGKLVKIRPASDMCQFVTPKVVENMAKRLDVLVLLEKSLADVLGTVTEKLQDFTQASEARRFAFMLGIALVRAAMGKSIKGSGISKPLSGNALAWSDEKIVNIKTAWADHLETTHAKMKGLKKAL